MTAGQSNRTTWPLGRLARGFAALWQRATDGSVIDVRNEPRGRRGPRAQSVYPMDRLPEVQRPVLVPLRRMEDAGDAATAASVICVTSTSIFVAKIDPEEFFDFTSTRPSCISKTALTQRRVAGYRVLSVSRDRAAD